MWCGKKSAGRSIYRWAGGRGGSKTNKLAFNNKDSVIKDGTMFKGDFFNFILF